MNYVYSISRLLIIRTRMKHLKNSIKKIYARSRGLLSPTEEKPKRLIIEKCRWLNNADSPVILMIDDLANAWHSQTGNNTWDAGGDWGGGLSRKGSVYAFLHEHLLSDYPEVKITFFAVAGKISQYTHDKPFSFAEPLNFNKESKKFFRELNENNRFEIAYHGYNHGTPGRTSKDFVQEWKGFQSLEEACKQIEKGKEIFKDVFGRYPLGGKYGGWEHNEFADDSIDRSGFIWWCRDWMPRNIRDQISEAYYEPQFFGENFVVALPSTVHGFFWNKKQVDKLIAKRQIIAIEEHISPIRPDGQIQTPNIIDDIQELTGLFAYLRNKRVWYATASEVAEYFVARSRSLIFDIMERSFKVRYDGKISHPELTLDLDCSGICSDQAPYINMMLPDGRPIKPDQYWYDTNRFRHIVTVPLQNGEYQVKESQSAAV